MDILQSIEQEFNNINAIRNQLFVAKKVQLHPNIDGYDSPESYGVYRSNGGNALGVVGKQFEPMDLNLFLDAIVLSATEAGLDLSGLTYKEHIGGSKVSFDIPLKATEIQTPMVGDVTETKLQFKTGFDGKTKVSLGFYTYRLWCSNGCGNWKQDLGLSFKNTYGNKAKSITFVDEIIQTVANINDYNRQLGDLAKIAVTQKQIDEFFLKVTGTTLKADKEISTRKQNILNAINRSVGLEIANTGANMFSVLQGATRYATHDMAKGSEEALLFNAAAKFNMDAHKLAFASLS